MIKYKIVEIDPTEHSIVVRYYTDTQPEEVFATHKDASGRILRARTDVNITLYEVPPPVGEALHQKILSHAPAEWLLLKEVIADPTTDTSLAAIFPEVGVERSGTPPQLVASPVTVPAITPLQLRLVLSEFKIRESWEAAVAAGSLELQDWYAQCTYFKRDDSMVSTVATEIGVNSIQLDAIWTRAAQL